MTTAASLKGKFVRLPLFGTWTKVLDHEGNHVRLRTRRGKPAIWFAITQDTEIRDKAGVEAVK